MHSQPLLTFLLTFSTFGLTTANWLATCTNYWLDGSVLTAWCLNEPPNSQYQRSSLDLNGCLGNFNGDLECANWGNAFQSCNSCSWDDGSGFPEGTIGCTCENEDGNWRKADVITGLGCIENSRGTLECWGHN